MVYIEIITKIVVCFYEGMTFAAHMLLSFGVGVCTVVEFFLFHHATALWTRQSHGQIIGGATPGKIVMGIRILYVEAVLPLDPIPPVDINLNQLNHTPLRALVFPGKSFPHTHHPIQQFNKNKKIFRLQSRFQKGTASCPGQKFADGSTVSILFCHVLLSQQPDQL